MRVVNSAGNSMQHLLRQAMQDFPRLLFSAAVDLLPPPTLVLHCTYTSQDSAQSCSCCLKLLSR